MPSCPLYLGSSCGTCLPILIQSLFLRKESLKFLCYGGRGQLLSGALQAFRLCPLYLEEKEKFRRSHLVRHRFISQEYSEVQISSGVRTSYSPSHMGHHTPSYPICSDLHQLSCFPKGTYYPPLNHLDRKPFHASY